MTKIRALTNVGEHQPRANNIHLGIIEEATQSKYNGRLIAFVCAGVSTVNNAQVYRFHIQPQDFMNTAVLINKTSVFPSSLIPELLTLNEFAQLGLNDATDNPVNPVKIKLDSFVNDITAFSKVGYQEVGYGELLGGGLTLADIEADYLNYDIDDNGIIGEIKKLSDKLDNAGGSSLGFLDDAKAWWTGFENSQPLLAKGVKWGAIGLGVNWGVKALTGRPIVGEDGYLIET